MKPNSARNWFFAGLAGLGIVVGVVVVLGIGFRVSGFLGGPGYNLYSIPSGAMSPTLRVGDRMFALANVYDSEPPPRGEVVVYKRPSDRKTDYVKRIIGVPGDRVQYRRGRLYLNGSMVERTALTAAEVAALDFSDDRIPQFYWEQLPGGVRYVIAELADDMSADDTEEFVVPPAHVFVLGDNRDNSLDSRFEGFIPIELLRTKPLYIYWSWDRSRIGLSLQPQ